MSAATKTSGPRLRLQVSCLECLHESSSPYRVQGDAGRTVSCMHPGGRGYVGDSSWDTPSWCPLLAAALAACSLASLEEQRR